MPFPTDGPRWSAFRVRLARFAARLCHVRALAWLCPLRSVTALGRPESGRPDGPAGLEA